MFSHLKEQWIKELRALPRASQAPPEVEVLLEPMMVPNDLILGHVTTGVRYDPLALLGLLYERSTGKRILKPRHGCPDELYVKDTGRHMAKWLGLAKGLDSSVDIVVAVEMHDLGHDGNQIAGELIAQGAR